MGWPAPSSRSRAVGQRAGCASATPGRHLVPHALAAAAVAERLGVPLDEVAAALAAGSHAEHRMEVAEASSGATAGRRHLQRLTGQRGRRARLPRRDAARRPAGAGSPSSATCSSSGRTRSACTARSARGRRGPPTRWWRSASAGAWIAEGAARAGRARVATAADAEEAAAVLERELAPSVGDLVLLKASRGIGLDRAVDLLRRGRAR